MVGRNAAGGDGSMGKIRSCRISFFLYNDCAITLGCPNCSLIVFRAVVYIVPFDHKLQIALSASSVVCIFS